MMNEDNEMEDYPTGSQPESDRSGSLSSTYCMYFSSGTTGLPKGVEISNLNLIINIQQLSAQYLRPPKRNEKLLAQLPFFHVYGTIVAYLALYNGATIITMNKYKPEIYLDLIQEFKITCLHMVPPIVHMLATYPGVDSRDLSSVQTITCAAAPLDPLIAQKAAERLKVKDMRQLFGMTEILCATWSHVSCPKIDSVGVPLPGVSCKIVHPDKRFLLEAGSMGELCVRGPQITANGEVGPRNPAICPRYYKNPKATGEQLDKDGYIKTGDLAYYDSEGFIYIVDRLKDVIKYKGAQVSPTETEILLRTHPGVGDCAVVGRPEQASGEVPAAFIVKTDDYPNLTAVEIREHVKGRISGFKELKGGIFFVAEIPRSQSGKILRRQLKEFWTKTSKTDKGGGATRSKV